MGRAQANLDLELEPNPDDMEEMERQTTRTNQRGVLAVFTDKSTRSDFWPKLRASVIIVIGFPFLVFFLHRTFHFSHITIIGIMCSLLHFYFFAANYVHWIKSPGLFRLKARYCYIEGYAGIPIPSNVDKYKDQAIKSISEFSAVRGTMPHLTLFGVGLLNFGIYLPIFVEQFDEWTDDYYFNKRIAAMAIMGGPAGMSWLGVWELNPNDQCHKIMHYIGVMMGVMANIGLGLALRGSIIPWIVATPGIIGFVLWIYFDFSAKMPSNDKEYVTLVSKRCLFSESMVILSSAVAFDVYLLYCVGGNKSGTGVPIWEM